MEGAGIIWEGERPAEMWRGLVLSATLPCPAHSPLFDTCRFISPSRKHRFAVMEASISLVATLLPAIEPVDFVTILPSVKSPIGRTVLKVGGGGGVNYK